MLKSESPNPRRALVFGGTGAVGSQVLRLFAGRGVETAFTYHRSASRARELAAELGQTAVELNLENEAALRAYLEGRRDAGTAPDILVHCAGTVDGDWDALMAVHCRSAYVACRELAASMGARGGGDIVFVGALDRGQSLPIPPAFAACQGALAAMAMAFAKELGPAGARVNLVALGLLDKGLSERLDRKLFQDYLALSALRRLGTPLEAARVIAWLALDNKYMSGKVAPVHGGI